MVASLSPSLVALVGPENARRLRAAGVEDPMRLLRIARTPEGRAQLASDTGLAPEQLLTWAHRAELQRVPELDASAAALLQRIGVRGLRDLVASDARRLAEALRRLDGSPQEVLRWIRAARKLRAAVHDEAPAEGAWEPDAALERALGSDAPAPGTPRVKR